MTEHPRLVVEITIAAPFERVWRALRDPEELRRWHGWGYDELDAEIDAIYVAGAEANERDGVIDMPEAATRITVEDRGEATVVRVTTAGPAGDARWADVFDEVEQGWIAFFEQLRFALERHPGEDRRTVHVAGAGRTAVEDGPLEPLGAGDRYATATTWGEELTGELWYRAAHQVGLTVDAYGDGLVVLHPKRAIVTTYGLDDAALAALERRWTAAAA
jgi:hypothetical protein